MKTNLKALFTRIMAFLLAAVLMCGTFTESASAATKNVINQNVSTKAASCNATDGSLPSTAKTLTGGSSYYFNVQVSSDLKVKKAQLYIKDVGSSSYKNVDTETAKNYMRYAYIKYTVANKSGTLKYYWKLTYTSGKTKTTSAVSVTVKKSSTTTTTTISKISKLNSFLSDSRWKVGTKWTTSQKPKLSSYGSSGCCAYVADLVKYVYSSSTPRKGTSYTSSSKVRAGDVLCLTNSKTGKSHWIFVYAKSGNSLSVVEGNYESSVVKTTGTWTISGSSLKRGSTTYTISAGYHFE